MGFAPAQPILRLLYGAQRDAVAIPDCESSLGKSVQPLHYRPLSTRWRLPVSDPVQPVSDPEQPVFDFAQTFATSIFPGDPNLPELIFASLPSDETDLDFGGFVAANIVNLLQDSEDEDEASELQVRDFTMGGGDLVIQNIASLLRSGVTGRLTHEQIPNYNRFAETIYNHAEIPVKSSPLNGVTLSTLVGGTGSVGILELFHSGVSPTEAALSVLFAGGALIVMGTADAVRRAVATGVEQRLLGFFGVKEHGKVVSRRTRAANEKRAKKKVTQARVAVPQTARRTEEVREIPAQTQSETPSAIEIPG